MRFINNPDDPLSELTRDVIAGFYRTFSAFGFGFVEPLYRRALAVELRHAGLGVENESRSKSSTWASGSGATGADLIVQQQLIVEVGPSLDSHAIRQLLNYLNVTKLPPGLVLYFGPKPKAKRHSRPHARVSHCRRLRRLSPAQSVSFFDQRSQRASAASAALDCQTSQKFPEEHDTPIQRRMPNASTRRTSSIRNPRGSTTPITRSRSSTTTV